MSPTILSVKLNLREGGLKNRFELGHLNSLSATDFHSDQAHEPQPPAVSFLAALEIPKGGGGDTIFSSTTASYDLLSPTMQKFVDTLWCENDSKRLVSRAAKIGGATRRAGASIYHPVVTVHPVTKRKVTDLCNPD